MRNRKGVDPSYTPKKKKFHFKTATDAAISNYYTASLANTRTTDGGIKYFTVNVNNLANVWNQSVTAISADGFDHVAPNYNEFYTIGGRVTYSFDMINTAGHKLYMFCSNTDNPIDDLNIATDSTQLAQADPAGQVAQTLYRREVITALEERVSKKLVSTHWLQRGDGYHSIGRISLNYKPHWLDPSRGKLFDDQNGGWATTTTRSGNWDTWNTTINAPTKRDYIHIILVPVSEQYIEEFQGDATAMVWGKVHLSQIVIACLSDTATAIVGSGIDVQEDIEDVGATPPA